MTDKVYVILGARSPNDPEPEQILSWNGQAWVAIPNPKIVASGIIPYPIQWITGTPISSPAPVDPQIIGIDLAIEPEKKKHSDGCTCKKCKEFFPYAEPNQDDGSLVCYACRHGL